MIRRLLCLICAVLLLFSAPAASAQQETDGRYSFDFDLKFTLEAGSFPALLQSRVSGYAELVNRLALRGSIAWSDKTESMEMDADLYYTDNPSLSYPFRLYGTRSRLFLTSPLINNQILFMNQSSLLEFSAKAKSTLGIPLPYLAFLYPYTTEVAFAGMAGAWNKSIKTFKKSGAVTDKRLRKLSERWADQLSSDPLLQRWIMALADGSQAPAVVEAEMNSLPDYVKTVTGYKKVSVIIEPGSQLWRSSSGDTLFTRRESEDSLSLVLSLPASENGYVPCLSWDSSHDGSCSSFTLAASLRLDPAYAEQDGSAFREEGEDADYEYEDLSSRPECLLDISASGSGFPRELPADSSFEISASVQGAVYPNFALRLQGETRKDGSVSVSFLNAESGGNDSAEILRCAGTFLPSVPKDVPDYMLEPLDNVYSIFAFNEERLADFTKNVVPLLVRSLFSFVEAAPTSACQSFLDDLTEIGLLDMLLSSR